MCKAHDVVKGERFSEWANRTRPLRFEKRGTERPVQNRASRVAFVAAARLLGGQLFVRFASEIDPRFTLRMDF